MNEYCSPENFPLLKWLQGCCATPTCTVAGKAAVRWEETTKRTNAGTGIGVLASTDRFAEITTGKSSGQLGGDNQQRRFSQVPLHEENRGRRIGAWGRRSDERGVTPS